MNVIVIYVFSSARLLMPVICLLRLMVYFLFFFTPLISGNMVMESALAALSVYYRLLFGEKNRSSYVYIYTCLYAYYIKTNRARKIRSLRL